MIQSHITYFVTSILPRLQNTGRYTSCIIMSIVECIMLQCVRCTCRIPVTQLKRDDYLMCQLQQHLQYQLSPPHFTTYICSTSYVCIQMKIKLDTSCYLAMQITRAMLVSRLESVVPKKITPIIGRHCRVELASPSDSLLQTQINIVI